MFKIVLAACLVAYSLALHSNWNQETRDYILEIHNDFRRHEDGCQINKLVYDMDLERQAKVWAENCVFQHEEIEGIGSNLAYNANDLPEKTMIKNSSQSWYDEKENYRYGQHRCGSACHYTQLVWDKTQKFGCWSTRCPTLRNAYKNSWYFVCYYSPKGNLVGEQPYQLSCDSPCRAGQTEEDGLCVGDIQEDDGGADDEDGACEDLNDTCPRWAEDNQCNVNPGYMLKNCKLSCTGCGPMPTTECVDKNDQCASWAARGECDANPPYMHRKCKKSCNKC